MNAEIIAVRHLVFVGILLTPTHLFAVEAANVEFVWGSASATTASGAKRQLVKGMSIEVGDTVVSEDARVQLRFTDGGFVSLSPHSEFRVNAYSYNGAPDGTERLSMELMKGGLRTISGLIGKAIQAAYEMKTAVATMGIRGTEYTVVYGDSVSGTVSAGAIAVCNAGGCLDVVHGQSYQVVDLNTKPIIISKAAFLPPPQPTSAKNKTIAESDEPLAQAEKRNSSSDPDKKSSTARDERSGNDFIKFTAEKESRSIDGQHGSEKFLQKSQSSAFQTLVSEKQKLDDFKIFEKGSASLEYSNTGKNDKDASLKSIKLLDANMSESTGKGKPKYSTHSAVDFRAAQLQGRYLTFEHGRVRAAIRLKPAS
ncbi:MAG TPA: FecR domain-containing protein [Pyrinomonadaceae bacterium]|nr:FecR domain-containing protein [Pyrinomonadaceae bacterium]